MIYFDKYINTDDPRLMEMHRNLDRLYADGELINLRNVMCEDRLREVRKNIFLRMYDWVKNKMYKPNEFENKLFILHGLLKDYDSYSLNYECDEFTHILYFSKYPKSLGIIHLVGLNNDLKHYKLDYPFILEDEGALHMIEMFDFDMENKKINSKIRCKVNNEEYWDRLRFFPAAEFEVSFEKARSAIDLFMVRIL